MNLVLQFLSGVVFVLLGMTFCKAGLQKGGGELVRNYVYRSTRHRWQALLLGTFVTFVLQSATAILSLVVGLTNVGLLSTVSGLAVALGAGIGTSLFLLVLAQALAFPLQGYAVLLLFVGLICIYMGRKRGSNLGKILVGFGMILYGLQLLSLAEAHLDQQPWLAAQIAYLQKHPLATLLIATAVAALLQSSTASLAILLSIALGAGVPLDVALVAVLGVNLGGSLMLMMTSTHGPTPGRHILLGNLLMRLLTMLLFVLLLDPWQRLTAALFSDVSEQIAVAHVTYNVTNALLFMPLLRPIEQLLHRLLPPELESGEVFRVKYLDPNVLGSPVLALGNVVREIIRMSNTLQDMFMQFMEILTTKNPQLIDQLEASDDQIDVLNREIKFYLARISQSSLTEHQTKTQFEFLSITAICEEIGDAITRDLVEVARKMIRQQLNFSEEGWREIQQFHTLILENIHLAITAFSTRNLEIAKKVLRHKRNITNIFEELQQGHLNRLQGGRKESFATSAMHMELLSSMLRINVLISKLANGVVQQAEEQRPAD